MKLNGNMSQRSKNYFCIYTPLSQRPKNYCCVYTPLNNLSCYKSFLPVATIITIYNLLGYSKSNTILKIIAALAVLAVILVIASFEEKLFPEGLNKAGTLTLRHRYKGKSSFVHYICPNTYFAIPSGP